MRAAERLNAADVAASVAHADNLTVEDTHHVRSLVRSYLRGDSQALQVPVQVLEKLINSVIEIGVWAIPNVTVTSGSVLSFGPGANVLLACTLTIEDGGRVRSYGTLTIDWTSSLRSKSRSNGLMLAHMDWMSNMRTGPREMDMQTEMQSDDALDLGATVLPVLAKAYWKQALGVLIALWAPRALIGRVDRRVV